MKDLQVDEVTRCRNPVDLDALFDDARPAAAPRVTNASVATNATEARGECHTQSHVHSNEKAQVIEPQAPRELSLEERIEVGYVNPGWRPAQWAARLLQLAERCERLHAELAEDYRRWAANVLTRQRR